MNQLIIFTFDQGFLVNRVSLAEGSTTVILVSLVASTPFEPLVLTRRKFL